MTDSTAATGLKVQLWDDKFFKEYFQENPFKPYMGTGPNSIIQVKEETVKRHQSITFALLNKLNGAGVTGSSTLEGNEEDLGSRSFKVTVDKLRNGVRVAEMEEQVSAISLRNAARPALMDWAQEYGAINRIIASFTDINGVAYGSASEAQKDAWLVDNADRVLFGSAKGNNAANDHSAALDAIDNTNDKASSGVLGIIKRMALTANPKVRPIRVGPNNKRYYVAFVHPFVMRDLKADTVISNAQKDVNIRMENNRLFQGGDIEWDGIIVHEVDNMPILADVGSTGTVDASPIILCGAQAIGNGIAKRWTSKTEKFDYDDKHGVAVETIDAIEKMTFGSGAGDTDDLKDHGIATAYVAAEPDA